MRELTPEDKEFLKEIIANPEDDAVRLIYADWLEDHDDPRGQLIRVQCELESLSDYDQRRHELERREQELLEEQRERCLAGVNHAWGHSWEIRRGFIDTMSLSLVTGPLDQVSERLEWEPIRNLHIDWISDDSRAELANWQFLSRVRSLSLGGNVHGHHELRDLFSSPYLTQLTELSLTDECLHGPEGAGILAEGESLSNVITLSLCQCTLGPSGWETLLASPYLTGIQELTVLGERLGSSGAQVLADSLKWENLHTLRLQSTEITDEGYRTISRARWLDQIFDLELSRNGIKPRTAEVLLASPRLSSIQRLDLRGNRIGFEGAHALAKNPALGQLRYLNLSENGIGERGMSFLARSPHLLTLRSLDLARCAITDEGARSLGESEFGKNIHALNLSGNSLTVFGVKSLLASGNVTNLHSLTLSHNDLDDRGLQVIARSEHLGSLRELDLGANNLAKGEGIQDLIQFDRLPQLQSLDLSDTYMPSSVIGALCLSPLGKRLRQLDLSGNYLWSKDLAAVLSLADSSALQWLSIGGMKTEAGEDSWISRQLHEAFGSRFHDRDIIPF